MSAETRAQTQIIERAEQWMTRQRASNGYPDLDEGDCLMCGSAAGEGHESTDPCGIVADLLAALRAPVFAGWLPIESAPTDGSYIVGGCAHKIYGWLWSKCRYYMDLNAANGGYFLGDYGKPTHWHPIAEFDATAPVRPSAIEELESLREWLIHQFPHANKVSPDGSLPSQHIYQQIYERMARLRSGQ